MAGFRFERKEAIGNIIIRRKKDRYGFWKAKRRHTAGNTEQRVETGRPQEAGVIKCNI
jgi:hypothetical protein